MKIEPKPCVQQCTLSTPCERKTLGWPWSDPGRCIDMYNLYKCDDSFRYYNNIRHQIAILRTWPKVFSRSTKACCKLLFLTKYFSYSFSSMIIVSNVWAPDMKPHCISSMKIIVLVSFSTALWVKFKLDPWVWILYGRLKPLA